MQLKEGTLLQGGKYRIEKVLGQGGFGITYLAENTMLDGKVAIKEFFFKRHCARDGETSRVTVSAGGDRDMVGRFRQKFIKEARTIFKLNHPNIVRIHDIFEENDTAYYVMELVEGESLNDMVKRRGAIPEAEAIGYIREVGNALSYIHGRSLNHLDIKPDNIMMCREYSQILVIDFGVAKQYDAETSEGTTDTPVGISHGYSPAEQYRKNGVQSFSPQSDVYALAATLYKLLTGVTPPEAMEIQDEGLPLEPLRDRRVSESVISAIVNAMKPKSQRTQSVEAFVNELGGDSSEATVVEVEPEPESEPAPTPTPQQSRLKKPYIIAAILAACVVLGVVLFNRGSDEPEPPVEVETPATQPVASTEQVTEVETPQQTTGMHQGHEWVDLGLPSGTKWATTNVGASSPSDYGNYFAWGETSTKSNYEWSNLKYCTDTTGDKFSKYVTDSKYGTVDGKEELDPSDDAAYVNWGNGWRMPSETQLVELRDKCEWTWTSMDGHDGYKVVGPNGFSLFLPAAGCRYGSELSGLGSSGSYWSRSLYLDSQWSAYGLYFSSGNVGTYSNSRDHGRSVRAVLAP